MERERVEAMKADLVKERERALVSIHRLDGAIALCQKMMDEMAAEQAPEPESEG